MDSEHWITQARCPSSTNNFEFIVHTISLHSDPHMLKITLTLNMPKMDRVKCWLNSHHIKPGRIFTKSQRPQLQLLYIWYFGQWHGERQKLPRLQWLISMFLAQTIRQFCYRSWQLNSVLETITYSALFITRHSLQVLATHSHWTYRLVEFLVLTSSFRQNCETIDITVNMRNSQTQFAVRYRGANQWSTSISENAQKTAIGSQNKSNTYGILKHLKCAFPRENISAITRRNAVVLRDMFSCSLNRQIRLIQQSNIAINDTANQYRKDIEIASAHAVKI